MGKLFLWKLAIEVPLCAVQNQSKGTMMTDSESCFGTYEIVRQAQTVLICSHLWNSGTALDYENQTY